MRLAVLCGIALACAAPAFAQSQTLADEEITLIGCLQGDGSEGSPWVLAETTLPPPPPPPPPPGARGGRGGRGGGPPGGGRGAAPPPPPDLPKVNVRLMDVDLAPWRGMRVQVDGSLGAEAAGQMREFHVIRARSAWGTCP